MSYEWAMAVTIIRGIGQAPLTALVFGTMGDVIEYGQWKFHIRQESLVFGGGSLGFKIGTGLTSALISVLLTSAGYLSSTTVGAVQPESAKQMRAVHKYCLGGKASCLRHFLQNPRKDTVWSDTIKPYTQGDIMNPRKGVVDGTEIYGRI